MVNKPIYANNYVPLTLDNISNNVKNLLRIEKQQSKTFITFGSPMQNYENSVNRICEEVRKLNFFDEIKGLDEQDLQNDVLFWNKHSNFIKSNHKGYGFWLWKSYLIKKTLDQINNNDILIYCDADCQINENGKRRLTEYIDILNSNKENYGLISFQSEFTELQYTKKTIFDNFQVSDKNMLHCLATVIIIKKNTHSVNIINEWQVNCEKYNLINDYTDNEDVNFIENRNDQSILSILVNKYGSIKLLDETDFHPNEETDGYCYPFLGKRLHVFNSPTFSNTLVPQL
jgi:hypothetical protein